MDFNGQGINGILGVRADGQLAGNARQNRPNVDLILEQWAISCLTIFGYLVIASGEEEHGVKVV